jgi:vacuolar-type H+-ATPase subunit F/Vma7
MAAPVYLGDEVTAAGFRLAGVETIVPREGQAASAFADACTRAPLVMVCAALVPRIGTGTIRAAVAASSPPVAVLPDLAGRAPLPDTAHRLRRQLGLEA